MESKFEIQKQYYKKNGEVKSSYQIALLIPGKTLILKTVFKRDYYTIQDLLKSNPELLKEINTPETAKEIVK